MAGKLCFSLAVMLLAATLASALTGNAVRTCRDRHLRDLPFCNVSAPVGTRVADLLSRLTDEQKIAQLDTNAPAVPDFALEKYNWWSECLHGVLTDGATIFPAGLNLGATFNMSGVHEMAQFISTEGRALHNKGQVGLTFFGAQETPGEDPFLNGEYATAYVTGLQEGDDPRCLKVVATCKHYAAYSLENADGVDRHHQNAVVDERDLAESYFPAFGACAERAGVRSVMCSYNEVNGVPSCANPWLQDEVLREQWGFKGFIASDCDAVKDVYESHKYSPSPEAAVADSLKAGCDLDCTSYYGQHLGAALEQGLVTSADLDRALGRLLTARFELGMFDTAEECAYASIPQTEYDTPEARALALQLAREGIVLLKNDRSVLPFGREKSIAVVGPQANTTNGLLSNYHGAPPAVVSVLEGITSKDVVVNYAAGCANITCDTETGFGDAVDAARNSDVVAVFVGLDPSLENEGHDRTTLELPGHQSELVRRVVREGKPTVVVLINGGPIADDYLYENAPAVVEAFYPGEMGGAAIADVLFGDYNPGGRLPYTIYKESYCSQIMMSDMAIRNFPGRTYRYLQVPVIAEFGAGLSYTTFNVTWLDDDSADGYVRAQDDISYHARVKNTGSRDGDEVVLAFMHDDGKSAPLKQLFGFQRVHLKVGQETDVYFTLPAATRTAYYTPNYVAGPRAGSRMAGPLPVPKPRVGRIRVTIGGRESTVVQRADV